MIRLLRLLRWLGFKVQSETIIAAAWPATTAIARMKERYPWWEPEHFQRAWKEPHDLKMRMTYNIVMEMLASEIMRD